MKEGPIVIGGVGGSGTRLFATILKDLGFYLGADLNAAFDNLWFTLLFKRQELWPPETHKKELTELLQIFCAAMIDGFSPNDSDLERIKSLAKNARPQHSEAWLSERVESMLALNKGALNCPWGFKEPNSHIFLPVLIESLESMKYVHVIRHGVDMAYSENQNQLAFWGKRVLNRPIDTDSRKDSLAYWCEVHRRVEKLGAKLGDRFMLLNYDDFCRSPSKWLEALLHFLNKDKSELPIDQLNSYLKATTLNRRKGKDLSIFAADDLSYVESLGFEI